MKGIYRDGWGGGGAEVEIETQLLNNYMLYTICILRKIYIKTNYKKSEWRASERERENRVCSILVYIKH